LIIVMMMNASITAMAPRELTEARGSHG
jgi:hypothetical protein